MSFKEIFPVSFVVKSKTSINLGQCKYLLNPNYVVGW